VVTDLTITGKAAQFGRGVMQDVAGRIIDQFSANLAATMAATGAAAAADAAGAVASDSAGPTAPTASVAAPAAPLPQAADSIDLLGTAGAPVLKRAIPLAVGAVVVVAIIIWVAKR
jgi:uncharacterized protein